MQRQTEQNISKVPVLRIPVGKTLLALLGEYVDMTISQPSLPLEG